MRGTVRGGSSPSFVDSRPAAFVHLATAMSHAPKRSVYILRSMKDPTRSYVGLTADIATRVADHNAGACPQTARHVPWRVVVLLQFADERRAALFEKYLKSSSGRAFAQAHFA
jgi:putative endonuclease